MIEAARNDENLVKLSRKMGEKLRGFVQKVKDGITTVPYVPGALFELAKQHKAAKQKAKEELETTVTSPKATETKEEKTAVAKMQKEETAKKTEEKPKSEFGKSVDELAKSIVEENNKKKAADLNETEVEEKKDEAQPKKDMKSIHGQNLAQFISKQPKEAEETKVKENEPIEPVTIEVGPQVEPETKHSEEKPKKEKKDLKDLTVFDTYQDYKFAYFWNYKMNKYDADVLEKVAKDYAKEADTARFRTLLTEADFNEKKAKQVKDKEIADIEKAHQEEMAAAEEKRQADVQAAIDQRQAEVDELNEKLATARSKNRTLTSKLKIDNEALEKIKEAVAPLGIAKIDEIISSAANKRQGIDDRAAEREKNKEESKSKVENVTDFDIEAETDRIMKRIHENVYGPEEQKNESKEEVESKIEEKTEEPKDAETPSTSTEPVEPKEEPTVEEDNNSLVNELASYDEEPKEVSTPSVFDTTAPNVELEPVPFTPSWKLGSVENQISAQDNTSAIDFTQVLDDSSKSKGKTR